MIKNLYFTVIAAALLVSAGASRAVEVSAHIEFGSVEISIMQEYFHEHGYKDSHKKKGKKSLPPGIAKNLGRGKPLPPGIAKTSLTRRIAGPAPTCPAWF